MRIYFQAKSVLRVGKESHLTLNTGGKLQIHQTDTIPNAKIATRKA
jgi:chemotaxis methyl-accepting protein methylase